MLLDSNIIIYAARPENSELRRFIAECTPAVSALSYVEVLGYHRLSESDRPYFEEFFGATRILAISQAVLNQTVVLRQMRKMTLGDSIIARTALVYNLTLVTRNIEDFRWITQLTKRDPFEHN